MAKLAETRRRTTTSFKWQHRRGRAYRMHGGCAWHIDGGNVLHEAWPGLTTDIGASDTFGVEHRAAVPFNQDTVAPYLQHHSVQAWIRCAASLRVRGHRQRHSA